MDRRIYKEKYDPLAVMRGLIVQSDGKINDWIKEHQSADAVVAAVAEEKLVNIARSVFGVTFPEVTDSETLVLLDHFNGWMQGKD